MTRRTPLITEEVLRGLPSKIGSIAQKGLLAFGIVSATVSIAGEWSSGRHFLNVWLLENVNVLGALLNLLLVAVVLYPGRIQSLNEEVRDPVVSACARCINLHCLRFLTLFWRCLGLIYVVQLYVVVVTQSETAITLTNDVTFITLLPKVATELFSVGSTLSIALVYVSLRPTFLRKCVEATLDAPDADRKSFWRHSKAFWVAATAILLIGIPSALSHGFIPHLLETIDHPNVVSQVATLLNGVAAAIALAYFVGRMDSKFILNWQWVIPMLYLYAGLQVYSKVLYSPDPGTRAIFVYTVFTMKCALFIFLSNFFESRRVLYYAVQLVESKAERDL